MFWHHSERLAISFASYAIYSENEEILEAPQSVQLHILQILHDINGRRLIN
ncbi:hypothetical protein LguiA_022663 [Lonicera macranthoides]